MKDASAIALSIGQAKRRAKALPRVDSTSIVSDDVLTVCLGLRVATTADLAIARRVADVTLGALKVEAERTQRAALGLVCQ